MTCRKAPSAGSVFVALALGAPIGVNAPARGDQVVVNGAEYAAAEIIDMQDGRIRFRSAAGILQAVWVDEVDRFTVNRGGVFVDLNKAEQFRADGEYVRAVSRYQRTLRLLDDFWPDVVAARMVMAADAAGRLDEAARFYVRALRGRFIGAAGVRLMPDNIPSKRHGRVIRALEALSAALAKPAELDGGSRALLEALRFDILRRTQSKGMDAAARTLVHDSIPPAARSRRLYEILLAAAALAAENGVAADVLDSLDRGIRDAPRGLLPDYLLLKARLLLQDASTREQIIRASWPALRVPIHFPDDPKAADGLYLAATALERIGRRDKAINMLNECLAQPRRSPETDRLATTALQRLQSDASPGG